MRTTLLALLGATAAFMAADRIVQRFRHHESVKIVAERADQTERWDWRGAVAAGKTLEIRGISGSIRAEPAAGTPRWRTCGSRWSSTAAASPSARSMPVAATAAGRAAVR